MGKTYSTKPEFIAEEIIPVLGDYVEDFDLDAIFDAVAVWNGKGYVLDADAEEFEDAVEAADMRANGVFTPWTVEAW